MDIDNPNEEDIDTTLSIEDQQLTVDLIDLRGINEVLIGNNIILKCKFVFKTVNESVPEFKTFNDLLPSKAKLDRDILKKRVSSKISAEQMGEELYQKVLYWINYEGSPLIVQYLPYLSMACDMNFHRCTIKNHDNHLVFQAGKRNHDLSRTIYYICDASEHAVIAIFITEYAYINRIHDTLLQQTDINVDDKVQLYSQLIAEHIIQANNVQFHQHLLLLSKWQNIYILYKDRLLLRNELTGDESLNYCRCLIILSKYSDAEEKLQKLLSDRSVKTDEVWYLRAKAERKRKKGLDGHKERENYENYSKARSSVLMAICVKRSNENALKEQTIIDKLIRRRSLDEAALQYDLTRKKRSDNCLSYNILSIDGGGIRGLMAAIWLRELERETKCTCSSMFQMMAGTSTGAIIAAGLSVPRANNPTVPDYNAGTLVSLYKTCGKEIFNKKSRIFCSLRRIPGSLAPQYSSDGRQRLFEEYFRDTRLHECLTDILIPAVKSRETYTHLFTRDTSSYSTPLVDVLMATTAAPTYFSPHYWNGRNYIDGGVQMNNPTLAAYTKAREYGHDTKDIYILSLGTGDYIKDPLVANAEPDILYYIRHRKTLVNVLLNSQQHNVDYQMSKIMNDENYYRWQVWFDEVIELDDYEESIVNRLENIAYEYWEEMKVHDNNRLNRLIERLKQE